MDNKKINKIITTIAIIILVILISSIKNTSLAVSRKASTADKVPGTYTTNNYIVKESWDTYVKNGGAYISGSFLRQSYTFCIQNGQEINFADGDRRYSGTIL